MLDIRFRFTQQNIVLLICIEASLVSLPSGLQFFSIFTSLFTTLKTILYISYDGLTDALGQSQILPYVIGLSKLGYCFHIISCEKPNRFELMKDEIQKICTENHISWHPLPYHKKPPVFSTIRDSKSIRKKALEIYQSTPYELVHCRSYISSITGLYLKKKLGVKFIFDMRGFWADERVDGNLWNLNNPIYRTIYNYFKNKEKQFCIHSDAIISLTDAAKKEMIRWNKNYSSKIQVIPCAADEDLFDTININKELKNKLKSQFPSEAKIVSYLGSLGTWYMLNEMLDFYSVLISIDPSYHFMIVSNDIWKKEWDDLLNQKKIPKKNIHVFNAKRTEMPTYISLSEFSLFFIKPCYSKISSSPTKHGEIMMMGVPIITNSGIGDMQKIISETKSGVILHEFDNFSYKEAILDLKKINTFEIRKNALEIYSLKSGVTKYAAVYQKNLH